MIYTSKGGPDRDLHMLLSRGPTNQMGDKRSIPYVIHGVGCLAAYACVVAQRMVVGLWHLYSRIRVEIRQQQQQQDDRLL